MCPSSQVADGDPGPCDLASRPHGPLCHCACEPPGGLRVFLGPTDTSQRTPPMPGRARAGQGDRGTLGLHGLTLGCPSSGCPRSASQPPVCCKLPESRGHCTVGCSAPELTGWEASLRSAQGPHRSEPKAPPMDGAELRKPQRRGCGPAHCIARSWWGSLDSSQPFSCHLPAGLSSAPEEAKRSCLQSPAEIRTARPVGLGIPWRPSTLDSTLSLPRA